MSSPSSFKDAFASPPARADLAVDLAVDQLRGHASGISPADRKFALDFLGAAALGLSLEPPPELAFETATAPTTPAPAKRFAAAAFLRALSADSSILSIGQTRGRAMALFDSALGPVYKGLHLKEKQPSHEKEAALGQVAEEFEAAVVREVKSLDTALDLRAAQNHLYSKLRGPVGKALLLPVIPEALLATRLDDLFKAVDDAANATPDNFAVAHSRADELLDTYVGEAEACGNAYCLSFLKPIADALASRLSRAFTESDYSKPASLTVSASPRRYPLSTSDLEIHLILEVRNTGPGYARDVRIVIDASDGLTVDVPETFVGGLAPGDTLAELPCTTTGKGSAFLIGQVVWYQLDGESESAEFDLTIQAQRDTIDWESLTASDPYALNPVTKDRDLAGRQEILERLSRSLQTMSMGSAYVTGQKRVGKTSVVKTLETQLTEDHGAFFKVLYIEGGDFVSDDPRRTLENLGTRIVTMIRRSDARLMDLAMPDFTGGLSPITTFLDDVNQRAEDLRFVLIVDEFDELPPDLYRRGGLGDPFFQSLRSASGRDFVGIILVGGEKLPLIMSAQGHTLNKFTKYQVDYFDRADERGAFADLVRGPVEEVLEVEDAALETLYGASAGNPYFVKLICREMFDDAVARRDAVVGVREVQRAVLSAVRHADQTNFAHFWEDGILEAPVQREEVSLRRRLILLALGDVIRAGGAIDRERLLAAVGRYNVPRFDAENELTSFIRRGVVEERGEEVAAKVGLFHLWLRDRSPTELVVSVSDPEAFAAHMAAQARASVGSEEIVALVETWDSYRARPLSEDRVRQWLAQFGDIFAQRLAFKLLEKLRFYGRDAIDANLRAMHKMMIERHAGALLPSEVAVSYLDGGLKSGGALSRRYALRNEVPATNAHVREDLLRWVKANEHIRAVVFVDDLIASGKTVMRGLADLSREAEGELDHVQVYVAAVCATAEGHHAVSEATSMRRLGAEMLVGDLLGPEDKVIGPRSGFFEGDERVAAEALFLELGQKLDKRNPLGYGGCGLGVVFESRCPNNSLPILWRESKDWKPLFPR